MPYKLQSPSNGSYTRGFHRAPWGSTQNVRDKQAHTGPPSSSRTNLPPENWSCHCSREGTRPDPAAVTQGSACFPPRIQPAGRVTALRLDSTLPGPFLPPPPCTTILNRPSSRWNIAIGIMSIKHRAASTTEGTLRGLQMLSLRLWAHRWESSSPGRPSLTGQGLWEGNVSWHF